MKSVNKKLGNGKIFADLSSFDSETSYKEAFFNFVAGSASRLKVSTGVGAGIGAGVGVIAGAMLSPAVAAAGGVAGSS